MAHDSDKQLHQQEQQEHQQPDNWKPLFGIGSVVEAFVWYWECC